MGEEEQLSLSFYLKQSFLKDENQWSRTAYEYENANQGIQRFISDCSNIDIAAKLHPLVRHTVEYLFQVWESWTLSNLSAYVSG